MNRTTRVIIITIGTIILAQFINGILAIIVGFAVIIVWGLIISKKEIIETEMSNLDLSSSEIKTIRDDIAHGDKSLAINKIQEAQNRIHASLFEQGIDLDNITPVIGRDIPWTEIVRQVFQVLKFDRSTTTIQEDDTVKAANIHKPYGFLLVESPILNVKALLPIIHRDDFALVSTVYDEPKLAKVAEQEELLVTYYPEKKLPMGFGGKMHSLHYVIVPQGTLQRYYEVNDDKHMTIPAPEKLFKKFTWKGEIKVEVNPDPEL